MILQFDVTTYIPFVKKIENNRNSGYKKLYVLDTALCKENVFELINNSSDAIFYIVNQDGTFFKNPIKLNISELEPAATKVRLVDEVPVSVIFE